MRTPSPSLIISCLALAVASTGTAYAAVLVTGKNVVDRSLTGSDIKNKSLTGRQLRVGSIPLDRLAGSLKAGTNGTAGAAGAPGSAGVPGAQGAKGDKGDAGPQGVSGKTYSRVLGGSGPYSKVDPPANPGTLGPGTTFTLPASGLLVVKPYGGGVMTASCPVSQCTINTGLYLDGQPVATTGIVNALAGPVTDTLSGLPNYQPFEIPDVTAGAHKLQWGATVSNGGSATIATSTDGAMITLSSN